jgi:hypothetical protein
VRVYVCVYIYWGSLVWYSVDWDESCLPLSREAQGGRPKGRLRGETSGSPRRVE